MSKGKGVKMSFKLNLFLLLVIVNSHNCNTMETEEIIGSSVTQTLLETTGKTNEAIEMNIARIEAVGNSAEKAQRDRIIPVEDIEKLYDSMVHVLDDIIMSIRDVDNAYKFLNAKGIERVVALNLVTSYAELKNRLLILLHALFEVAPITTDAVIPTSLVDRLLDIFESDDNLALKARALDVLNLWLPNNTKVQARVMKVAGLEPFYHQITKLDASVIKVLLELFNKVLDEHVKARNEKMQKTKANLDKLRLYQKIGLIERMSTPTVCNGILNIFEIALQFNKNVGSNLLVPVFEMMANIKPFCVNVFKGKAKAIELFNTFLKYVTDPVKEIFLIDYLNLDEVRTLVHDYVDELKVIPKDEF